MANPQYKWLREKMLAYIRDNPGCSGREIADHVDHEPRDLFCRFGELRTAGLIRKTGDRGQTRWFPA